jgi:hypothetical protein
MSASLSALANNGFIRQLLPDPTDLPAMDVEPEDDTSPVSVDPETGAITVEDGDGGVVINFNPKPEPKESKNFSDNLAELIDDMELGRIANDLLTGISADDDSRREWLETRARGLEMLGMKLEAPRAGASGDSAPMEGMSTVRHPLLMEASLRFQANARSEMLPTDGPVKIKNWSEANDELAEALERDLNKYLTSTATEYYPDTDQMLFVIGFGGSGFKKGYACPIRRRPVLESIDAKDVIVSEGATDLRNAPRVTHRIAMRTSMVKRMQIAGVYRDVDIGQANQLADEVDETNADIQGIAAVPTRPEDQDHTIYECYCELDISGFEHKKGLPLPYRVTLDRDSQTILEIRRNWDEEDPMCLGKMPLIRWTYVPYGLYGIGLVHILGNTTNALTAALREMLDAGMYANFPGALVSEDGGRQKTANIRVPPGGLAQIQTGGKKLSDVVAPLPYKDVSSGLMALCQHIEEMGQRLGGTAELQVGEGRADVPVGTMLATIEQATKVQDSVHKRLHAAQAEEFQLLKSLFREDPEAFWRFNKRPARQWDEATFLHALDNCDFVPMSDPNTPSHMHRLMKATALLQLAQAAPQYFDVPAVIKKAMGMAGISDIDSLMAPPGAAPPQPPNPQVIAAQTKLQIAQMDNARAQQDQQQAAQQAEIQRQFEAQQNAQKAQIEMAKLKIDQQRAQIDAQNNAGDYQVQVAQLGLQAQDVQMGHAMTAHQTATETMHQNADREQRTALAQLQAKAAAKAKPKAPK